MKRSKLMASFLVFGITFNLTMAYADNEAVFDALSTHEKKEINESLYGKAIKSKAVEAIPGYIQPISHSCLQLFSHTGETGKLIFINNSGLPYQVVWEQGLSTFENSMISPETIVGISIPAKTKAITQALKFSIVEMVNGKRGNTVAESTITQYTGRDKYNNNRQYDKVYADITYADDAPIVLDVISCHEFGSDYDKFSAVYLINT